MVSNMKYLLKAKRWSLLDFLYDRGYGTGERLIILDGEKEVFDFFKMTVDEDIADKTTRMGDYYTGSAGLETVLQISSSAVSFRKLLKHKFEWFRCILDTKFDDNKHRAYWINYSLKCNPNNYKIFTIAEKEIRGSKFQVIEKFTWYKFYKKCLASGMTEQELVFNK